MLERLSIRHVRTLRHLHRTRSMRDTARLVFRSQPAVSLQIKDLEEIVGFQIIYHKRGRILFTERGEALARAAAVFEKDLESKIDELRKEETVAVRGGVTQDLFAASGHMLGQFKGNGIELVPMNSQQIIRGCETSELQFGVAKSGRPLPFAEKAWSQRLSWASCDPVPPRQGPLELVLLSKGCHYHNLALRAFEDADSDSVLLTICDDWSDIAKNLDRGGITIVPTSWQPVLGSWPACDMLPKLPPTSLNLIFPDPVSDTARWAVDQVSRMVESALDEGGGAFADFRFDRDVRLFPG